MTYKRLKTILGRPKVEDHSDEVLTALRTNLAPDLEIYAYGKALSLPKMRALPGFDANLVAYGELQAKVDQSCKFESHESKQLIGRDCYQLLPYEDKHIGKKKKGRGRRLLAWQRPPRDDARPNATARASHSE